MEDKIEYYFITYQIYYLDGTIRNFNVIVDEPIPNWYLKEKKKLKMYSEQMKFSGTYVDIRDLTILFFKKLTDKEYLNFAMKFPYCDTVDDKEKLKGGKK